VGMSIYETPEFQALRREWAAKLKESGFRDIEQVVDAKGTPGRLLLGPSPGDLLRRKESVGESEEYYRRARAHTWTMPRGPERHIWELHSDGLSAARIERALKPHYGCSKKKIRRILREQKTAMLARMYKEGRGCAEDR